MNESEITEIRQNADIVDIISDYLPLVQKGKNYFAVCPFHDDHKPSMVISKEKQMFNCFTCHTGGNVFNFVMKYENCTYLEAIKIVADKIGINVNIKDYNKSKKVKNEKLYEIMNLTANFYLNNLNTKQGLDAKNYLKNRGIDDQIIRDFKIGLALKDKGSLANFLTKNNFSLKDLDDTGLINKSGLDIYDTFINRIMIPITDIYGDIVGFTGRIFHNENLPKYLNSKETVIFKKSEIIFNYASAKNYLRQTGSLIIVEGNMDAIKMSASGIKNVVALMGVSLSKEHLTALKKLRVPIIIMLDNDEAGLNGTIRNGDILYQEGIETQVIRLSGAKDPDEYIRTFGVEALKENIAHPLKYLDFKINYLKQNKDLNSASDLVEFIKEVSELIKNEDELTKDVLVTKIAKDNNLDANFLKTELFKNNKPITVSEPIVEAKMKKDKYLNLSHNILYFILNDVKYLRIFKSELGYFELKEEREIVNTLDYYVDKHDNYSLVDFISFLADNENVMNLVLEIINENKIDNLDYEQFMEYLKGMKRYLQIQKINNLKLKIKNEMDMDQKVKLMEKLTELKKGCVDYGRN